jgi:hypothetical protein
MVFVFWSSPDHTLIKHRDRLIEKSNQNAVATLDILVNVEFACIVVGMLHQAIRKPLTLGNY